MANKISINVNELEKKANRMRKQLEEYNEAIDAVNNECLERVSIAWKSKDNLGYVANLRKYSSGLKELGNFIKEYIDILEFTSQEYESSQQEVVKVTSSGRE